MRRHIACVSLLIVIRANSLVSADSGGKYHTARGWYSSTGRIQPGNYSVGDIRGPSCQDCFSDIRNYFVFDLTNIPRPIYSAKLDVWVSKYQGSGYVSSDPSENYELHDVVVPIHNVMYGDDAAATYADLGDGVVYGSRTMTVADRGSRVQITLNASAIEAMNATQGLFALGGSLTTLDDLPNLETTLARPMTKHFHFPSCYYCTTLSEISTTMER